MKRLLPLILAMASAQAADPVQFEVPRPGGPLRIAIDGGEFVVGRAVARPAQAAVGRAGIARTAAALGAPGQRVGLVGHLAGGSGTRVVITGRLAIEVPLGADPATFAAVRGLRVVRTFDWSSRFIVAEPVAADAFAGLDAVSRLRTAGIWAEPELILPLRRMAEPTDPLYATSKQWHLRNLGTASVTGGVAGSDINIAPHWATATPFTGAGINVATVDDGIDLTHPDLLAGIATSIDEDYVTGDGLPGHEDPLLDGHGTVVAGLIGARANGAGGVGVAYGSSLVALKVFDGESASPLDITSALGHRATATTGVIGVSNNSWGYRTLGTTTAGIDDLTLEALTVGVDQGRNGRGTVYVFAAGNDRLAYTPTKPPVLIGNDTLDWTQFNGNRRVIAVGAFGPDGLVTSYSQPGIGLLISAPGGEGSTGAMVSTDWQGNVGFQPGDYTEQDPPADPNGKDVLPNGTSAIGTSFAAPVVSGAVALLLQANPLLSWRDVPHILAHSASAAGGATNLAGVTFSADYGAGRLDVTAALALAAAWKPLPPESSVQAAAASAAVAIPDNDATGVTKTFSIVASADFTVEHAELTVTMTHARRGDVEFELIAPSGTSAVIARRTGDTTADLDAWTFSSVRTLGEGATGVGTWRVVARDRVAGTTGTLGACSLTLYGYRPYQAPTLTSIFPSAVLSTQATTTISVNGTVLPISEGGDMLGTLTLGGSTVAITRDALGWASASIPAATFSGITGPFPTTVTVSLASPTVRGVNYALVAGGIGTISLPVRAFNAIPTGVATNGTVVAGFPTTSGSAAFTDTDNDTLRYRLGTAPLLGSATVDTLTGVVTYAPTIGAMGSDSLSVIATDGMGDSAPVTISYTVERNVTAGLNISGTTGGGSGDGGGGGGCGAGGGAVGGLAGLIALLGLRRRRR